METQPEGLGDSIQTVLCLSTLKKILFISIADALDRPHRRSRICVVFNENPLSLCTASNSCFNTPFRRRNRRLKHSIDSYSNETNRFSIVQSE